MPSTKEELKCLRSTIPIWMLGALANDDVMRNIIIGNAHKSLLYTNERSSLRSL